MKAIKECATVAAGLAVVVAFGHILVSGVVLMLCFLAGLPGALMRLPATLADRFDRHHRIGAYAHRR